MKKAMILAAAGMMAMAAAAQWRPGQGVANDHATGNNPQDVVVRPRSVENGYGYVSYATVFGLTLGGASLPNDESTVNGVRLNLGWGGYAKTAGLDFGLFSDSGEFGGIGVNLLGHYTERNATGIQIGLANVTGGEVRGLQIGAVNYARTLKGVQIGFLNFATEQQTLPILNVGW